MDFFSDNAASVCGQVMDALTRANQTDLAYDADTHSAKLNEAFSRLFETEVTALWISTGTAANSLALASLCPPYGAIVCHREAHIQNDECGAPEFFTHGAKLLLAEGTGAKLTPASINDVLDSIAPDVHRAQPRALSITNATEYGQVYTPAQVGAIGDIARNRRLGFHMDGARFANAIAFLGCTPADLTWKAGVDVLSFGFVKNGGMSAEALICFRQDIADEIHIRRKRSGHLLSKGRYCAAQLLAMLESDVWLRNAHMANAGAQKMAVAAKGRLVYPVEANELFIRLTSDEAASLRRQGFGFYDWADEVARFVVAYDTAPEAIDRLTESLRAL